MKLIKLEKNQKDQIKKVKIPKKDHKQWDRIEDLN
jgi:hypothetical protein